MDEFIVTIIGAGVIGSSLGLALKQQSKPPRLLVHDKDFSTSKAAVKQGAFDHAEWNLINACEQADLVILAIPVDGVRPTLEAIVPYLKQGVVISDTTTNKVAILAAAEELLPEHAHFVGGNPIVFPAGRGHQNAHAALFRKRPYCLTPSKTAHADAVQMLVSIVSMVGGKPFFLDAAEHDGLITAVEQLPTLLSVALLQTLGQQASWREIRKMGGPLFKQVSAGADGDPDSLQAALQCNDTTLIHWLDRYIDQLQKLRTLLTEPELEEETLTNLLDEAIVTRLNWLRDFEDNRFLEPEFTSPKVETSGFMKRWIGFGR